MLDLCVVHLKEICNSALVQRLKALDVDLAIVCCEQFPTEKNMPYAILGMTMI